MSRSKAATLQEANKPEPKKSDVTQDYIDRLRKKSCGHRRQNSEFDRKRIQTVGFLEIVKAYCQNILEAEYHSENGN
ncbi:hypothetical protein ANCDUO_18614 [Ancylostoma duodenale]|uniref:Uncharacterized protein n=1 Tax=Ancylostoma duodenale TaxID=51022 RepID=A0A0C2G2N5_9BILA|nr:hypothetical protein ANCDUO_18614 [Ancylostoma duodenale]